MFEVAEGSLACTQTPGTWNWPAGTLRFGGYSRSSGWAREGEVADTGCELCYKYVLLGEGQRWAVHGW